MTLQEYIERETQEKTVSLWGSKTTFIPKLCKETIGDGQHLIMVWTMSERPYYWLVLVDSSLVFTDYEPDVEFEGEDLLELCFGIIAAEFGTEGEYPSINDSEGGSFESIVNMSYINAFAIGTTTLSETKIYKHENEFVALAEYIKNSLDTKHYARQKGLVVLNSIMAVECTEVDAVNLLKKKLKA